MDFPVCVDETLFKHGILFDAKSKKFLEFDFTYVYQFSDQQSDENNKKGNGQTDGHTEL